MRLAGTGPIESKNKYGRKGGLLHDEEGAEG